jgi:pimeloyl-ACP methyl ester carboxylesterase
MSIRVIFIHGFLEGPSMWREIIADLALSESEYQCVSLPGHGVRHDFPNEISMEGYVSYVLDQIHLEGVDRLALVGHSMGGYVASSMAARLDGVLHELCLFQSKAGSDNPEKKEERQRAIAIAEENRLLYIRTMLRGIFHPETLHRFEGAYEALVSEALSLPEKTIANSQYVMMSRPDQIEALRKRSFRISYFLGEDDRSIPLSTALDEAATLRAEHVVTCPGMAHVGHLEKKQEAVSFLLSLISRMRA